VLLMDGDLDSHFINQLEQKFEDSRFVRVDSDVVDKLIQKKDAEETKLTPEERNELTHIFEAELPTNMSFTVVFENLDEKSEPLMITQSEFMRRMKDMAAMGGGGMNLYGDMPDSYSLVVNPNHRLINRITEQKQAQLDSELKPVNEQIVPLKEEKAKLEKELENKKEEEIPQADKDKIEDLDKQIQEKEEVKKEKLRSFAKENKLVKQLVDIALLANNMLTGADLTRFVKRSIDLI